MPKEHLVTLKEAIEQYMSVLKQEGKSPRTLYTYGKDCEQMIAFFGSEKKLINILPVHVASFYKSDALLKIAKNGKERAPKTVNKTKMVFRGVLTWALEQGYIESVPLPKNS
jgi:site-specific recombinase XerC